MKLSTHFDSTEFACKCGCGASTVDAGLISKLEQLYNLMGAAAVLINSGRRCAKHSVAVGGTPSDGHVCGIAADIMVRKSGGSYYSGADIAEAAERVGFSGIGIISGNACHVDVRDSKNYVNSHWFGNERTGDNYIKTFQRGTKFPGETTKKKKTIAVTITIDGVQYGGTLTEK